MKQVALTWILLGVLCSLRGSGAQGQGSCPNLSNYMVVATDTGTLVASWEENSNFSSFNVEYGPTSESNLNFSDASAGPVVLTGLLNFTKYAVSVTPLCSTGESGGKQTLEADTRATLPSGRPDGFQIERVPGDGPSVFNIIWSPIPEHEWNGVPLGYYVFLYRSPNLRVVETYQVHYPDTSLVLLLFAGEYGIEIAAVNRVGVSPERFTSDPFEVGNPTESASFVDYPYFYILIPGVLFVAIIVGIIIVIFKKLRERNKGSISFAQGIDNVSSNYSKGFGNVIPMRDLSPNSPNVSASVPASSAIASPSFIQQHNHRQQLANRPLPLSPDPALIPAEDAFAMPMSSVSSHSSMNRKLTHPGPLPMLEENIEQASFVPMSRTMTDPSLGSVFSPVSINTPTGILQLQHGQQQQQHVQQQQQHVQQQQQHVQQQQQHVQRVQQQQQQQQQRGRSNTLPSPYEVPDQNAPPHDMHSNGAYLNSSAPRGNRGAGGSNIPPPPTHSPPPLTTNGELAHSFDSRHQHHQQQNPSGGMNSLPRNMHGKRSFSTSATQGRSIGTKGAPHMKSDGNIHMGDGEYYLPPGDSDEDPSIVSSSSHGAGSESAAAHQDRGRRPPYSYHHKQRRNPGMINGALASSDQLGNFGAGVGEGPIPPSYQLPPTGSGVSRDRKRESLFSETSTELSIGSNNGDRMQHDDKNRRESLYSESSGESTSGNHANPTVSGAGPRERSRNESVFSETSTESSSSKRHSPGWGVTKSDVGVSHRRQRSKSPPERETFSDVGGLVVHPQQAQNGFV